MRQLKISKQITGRDSFSIEKYLQEIGKIDVLTPDEEVALAKKIRSGDREARELLVKSNPVSYTHLPRVTCARGFPGIGRMVQPGVSWVF